MGKNEFCINTTEGCIWGKMSDFAEINKVAKSKVTVRYLGNYITWKDDNVYAVFHTEEVNYIVKIK